MRNPPVTVTPASISIRLTWLGTFQKKSSRSSGIAPLDVRLDVVAQRVTSALAEVTGMRVHAEAEALEQHPALLRLAELETLRELAKNANARLYLGFDRNGLAVDRSEAKQNGS